MSSFCKCKSYSHFFSKNISVYAIFNDQNFNDMLTKDIISFEQLGRIVPGVDPGRFLRGFDLINLPYLLYLFEKTSLGKQCRFRSEATKCGI